MEERSLPFAGSTLRIVHGGAGPLVVLSHALGPVAWGELTQLTGACTVAIPAWEPASLDAALQSGSSWFDAIVTELGFDEAALCVWSMSGPAAIDYAAEAPPLLSHLVLVDVAGLGEGLPELSWRDLPHLIASRLRGRPTRGFVRMLWRSWARPGGLDTSELEEATYRFLQTNPWAVTDPEDLEDEDDSMSEQLRAIRAPALVCAGRHSAVLGLPAARCAVDLLPQGELLVFEESSHALQLEESAKFQRAVAAFVNRRDDGPLLA